MNCPQCGEVCRCHPEPAPASAELAATDVEAKTPVLSRVLGEEGRQELSETVRQPDLNAWRGELSARLDRYRSRRRIRPPRYPSLSLQFGPAEPLNYSGKASREAVPDSFEPLSDHALALDAASLEPIPPIVTQSAVETPAQPVTPPVQPATAKIIEFPRFNWAPPPPPPDQLAEPVSNVPRILEVPEMAPPPPALGGITIEPAERERPERRPGIDVPLQTASLERRIIASFIDVAIVAVASALFGFVFWKVTAVRPPRIQILGFGAGIPAFLWFAYQYLLIVYGATTPGLRLAGLKLAHFDGTRPSRRMRRCRVLGSCLSAASLCMGYAWVFLDEDSLCWHDRITHTHLAPKSRNSPSA